jgi:uncharacterized protein YdhG (YjbR/CyaY superfamily)
VVASVEEYINSCNPEVKPVLREILRVAKAAVPSSHEVISYKMPALKQEKCFFYIGAFKNHIGIYPPVKNNELLKEELKPFANEKGNLKFKLSEPIPFELIARIALSLSLQYKKQNS